MFARRPSTVSRLHGVAFVCAALLSGASAAAELNGLALNGLALNGLALNGVELNSLADERVDAANTIQSREQEAARVWESVRQLSKGPLAQKK